MAFVHVQADERGIWLVITEREKGKGQVKSSPGHQRQGMEVLTKDSLAFRPRWLDN